MLSKVKNFINFIFYSYCWLIIRLSSNKTGNSIFLLSLIGFFRRVALTRFPFTYCKFLHFILKNDLQSTTGGWSARLYIASQRALLPCNVYCALGCFQPSGCKRKLLLFLFLKIKVKANDIAPFLDGWIQYVKVAGVINFFHRRFNNPFIEISEQGIFILELKKFSELWETNMALLGRIKLHEKLVKTDCIASIKLSNIAQPITRKTPF